MPVLVNIIILEKMRFWVFFHITKVYFFRKGGHYSKFISKKLNWSLVSDVLSWKIDMHNLSFVSLAKKQKIANKILFSTFSIPKLVVHTLLKKLIIFYRIIGSWSSETLKKCGNVLCKPQFLRKIISNLWTTTIQSSPMNVSFYPQPMVVVNLHRPK